MAGIRDLIKSISTTWAASGLFERYLYDCGLALDALLEKATQSAHAHMPGLGDPSALPLIGNDRLISQGLTESDENYATRLTQAFDAWQLAGNPWSLLRQVLGYLLNDTPAALVAWNAANAASSTWQSYGSGADTSKPPFASRVVPANWDWDSSTYAMTDGAGGWWRWWLVLFAVAPNDFAGPAPFTFGTPGVKIGKRPDCSIGLNVPPSTISGLRSIVALWQREGSWCHEIIVSFDATLFDPDSISGGGVNPDGRFGRWSYNSGSGPVTPGHYVPSRFSSARYCTGAI